MDEAMPRRNGNGRDRGAGGRDLQKLFDRLPPNAPEAEMALLGSMILDPNVIDEVIQLVTSGDAFYSESHAAIFDAMRDLHARTQSGDLVQLAGMLKDGGVLDGIGGADYLASLAEQVPTSVNAVHYARIVRDKAQLRNLIDAAGQIIYDAYHAGEHEEDGGRAVIDNAERRVFEIAERNASMDDETLEELLNRTMDMLEANEGRVITGVATGYADLDEKTSGLQPGELLILAARPSMGKTALALNLAEQVAFGGSPYAEHGPATPVGFFSMEMSKSALAQRLLCARAGVDSHRLRTNRLRKEDFQSLMEAAGMLSQAPLFIDDTPGLTVMQLRAKARRMVARHGVKCIFVDYLQLMSAPSSSRDGRQQEVSAISRGIKALARDLEIPIVCLAQLNRGAEQREGHRPRMADLRESGSIEQDADVIALLHREAYYHVGDNEWLTENEDKINLAELIIAKQRNGPTGVVKFTWEAQTTRFRTYAGYGYGDDGPGYASAAGASYGGAESIEPKPDVAGRVGFAPGSKSGPETDFRDGGGPDRDDWGDDSDEPAPF
ncbi:MAG: replicative DNA helicase [Planctomycetota bacterium]